MSAGSSVRHGKRYRPALKIRHKALLTYCGLLNDAVSSSNYTASNETIINELLKSMQKVAVTAYFKVLSKHLSGGAEENYENHAMIAGFRFKFSTRDLTTRNELIVLGFNSGRHGHKLS